MSNHDTGPDGGAAKGAPLARAVPGIGLAAVLVAAGFAAQALWPVAGDPGVGPSDSPSADPSADPSDAAADPAPVPGDHAATFSTTGRRAPTVSPPVVALPPDDVPDAAALFGARVVAVSYRKPATVVTRDGTRFRVGDALPSGAILDGILPGRLSVRVDGVETVLDPARGDDVRRAPD